nr:CUE domain-containing protein 2-A-like [Lytechinus pictus]
MATASASDASDLVKTSLSGFVTCHIPEASLEFIDDIVLSYMLGVLEDLDSDDGFEVEGFVEMMQAYIPGFEDVSSDTICEWVFKLANELSESKEKENEPPCDVLSEMISCNLPSHAGITKRTTPLAVTGGQRSPRSSPCPDKQEAGESGDDEEAQVRQLLEMFPASCSLEARRCLTTAKGQMEDAVQLMLVEMEKDDHAPTVTKDEWRMKKAHHDDKAVRNSILQKYGFVDVKDDTVTHRPVAPKQEKKKMVRYLNNQVCSTKGERFIETKKPMTEEMKKTYINLKPARSYHFH